MSAVKSTTRLTPNRFSADAKEGSTPVLLSFFLNTLHPTPYTPHLTPYTIHPTPYTIKIGALFFFMRAYAAYFRPQNIELYSIWQKKTPIYFLSRFAQTINFAINCENSCICAIFLLPLRPIIMLKYCTIAERIQNYENSTIDRFNPCV